MKKINYFKNKISFCSNKLPKLRKYSRELFSADAIIKLIELFFKLFRHYYNSVLDNNLFSIKFLFF